MKHGKVIGPAILGEKKCLRAHHSGLAHIGIGRAGPLGHVVYATSRTDSTLVVFGVHKEKGGLTFRQRVATAGVCARQFFNDDERVIVGNQDTQSMVEYRVDPADGTLTQVALVETPGVCPVVVCKASV